MMRSSVGFVFLILSFVLAGCPAVQPGGGNNGGSNNDPPVAQNQSVDALPGVATDITLTVSDSDGGPQPLSILILSGVGNGTLSTPVGTQVTFTPNPGFLGVLDFTYLASDGQDESAETTVCIEVTETPVQGSVNDCSALGGGNNGGNNGGGGGTGTTHDLALTIQSDRGDSEFMGVWLVMDAVSYTRAAAPYNDRSLSFRHSSADISELGTDPWRRTFEIEDGTVVTLIAFENDPGGLFTPSSPSPAGLDNPAYNEFIEFQVSDAAAAESERGVVSFTMTQDVQVTAQFNRMPLIEVFVTRISGAPLAAGTLSITENRGEILNYPENIPAETVTGSGSDLAGQGITGQTVVLTAVDIPPAPPNLIFDSWIEPAHCGGSRTCTLTYGTDFQATAAWRAP